MRLRRSWGVPLGGSDGAANPPCAGAAKAVLPTVASCVQTVGRHLEIFLVPSHYDEPVGGPDRSSVRLVTALDKEGREVRLPAYETEVSSEARRLFEGAYPESPLYEYCPVRIPEEAWAAYERRVPQDWMPSRGKSGPDVYAVRGPMPNSLVAKIPVQGGYAAVPLVPRIARDPRPGPGDPMFRLALRDVVRVQTAEEFARELGVELAEEARS